MLYLIGLGLWDEKDISLRGLDICKKCDHVYAELYTAKWGGDLNELEKIISKDITIIDRIGMEEDSKKIIEEAKEKKIAVLIPGDPLLATTHIKIVQEAREMKVKTEIVHSSSIYTGIGESGLSLYNFGKVVTIPTPQENYEPTLFYDEIKKNRSLGLHTLVLLDIEMPAQDGLKRILDIDKNMGKRNVIVMSKLGSNKKIIKHDTIETLSKETIPAPAVILIPGKLHFTEEEFLDKL
ncbi:MAG: diphthine synthase [Nanoarchaeota archaeon]|nr:diphthine synthase [Nanoarchaeota archaeon]MBU1135135.1 diphthine synthase [Nanoarchaeota archaeon]MBU2520189.1 diphthine synthase [Nanoarchaeota archaeon]